MSHASGEFHVFDTDIISECLRKNAQALCLLQATPLEQRRTTIINEGELLTGRYWQFQTADTKERLISAQQRFQQTKVFLGTFPAILPIDEESASLFFDLSKQRGLRKIGRRDLLIAAIAIRHGDMLTTGNAQDFVRVPFLKVRDWRES